MDLVVCCCAVGWFDGACSKHCQHNIEQYNLHASKWTEIHPPEALAHVERHTRI